MMSRVSLQQRAARGFAQSPTQTLRRFLWLLVTLNHLEEQWRNCTENGAAIAGSKSKHAF